MWEKAKNFWNRLGNTAMIAPRVAGTALNTATDIIDTAVALPKDILDVAKNTAHDIKNVFVDSWTKWKWYHKIWNVILSPVIATWTAVEWWIRSIITPAVNGVVNSRNTVKNSVTNAWRSTFGRVFSKKPISDFSYDKLKTADVIKKDKNRFSRLQFGKKKWEWVNVDSGKKDTWKVATAAAVTTAAAWTKEVADLKWKVDSLTTKLWELTDQLKNVLASNEKLSKENAELKKWNDDMKKLLESLKKSDKPTETKSEKKEDKWEKSEKKEEKKSGDKWPEGKKDVKVW